MLKKTRQISSGITPYDIFILFVTLLSIFNLTLYVLLSNLTILYVVGIIDAVLSGIFFVDFSKRFINAPRKLHYMIRDFGWADLLASVPLPQFKILRTFRLIKAYALIKKAGIKNIIEEVKQNQASGALYLIFFMIILLLEFGSIAVLSAESKNPAANITTASDAIWWVYVTITTVGYGDKYPITNQGRIVGLIVMLVGVGLFGVVTGFLANKFLPRTNKKPEESTSDVNDLVKIQSDITEMKAMLEKLSNQQEV